jgi:hypothetical protein
VCRHHAPSKHIEVPGKLEPQHGQRAERIVRPEGADGDTPVEPTPMVGETAKGMIGSERLGSPSTSRGQSC